MKCYTLFFVHDETMKIKPFIFLPPFGKHWVNNEQLFQVIIRKKQAKKKNSHSQQVYISPTKESSCNPRTYTHFRSHFLQHTSFCFAMHF